MIKIKCKTKRFPEGISLCVDGNSNTVTTPETSYTFTDENMAVAAFNLLKTLSELELPEL